MEWIEEEVVGKRLALVRCVGNQAENFVRDDLVHDLEELRGDLRRLLDCKKTLTISLAGELCGVDDGAIARIEKIFGKYERVGRNSRLSFINNMTFLEKVRNKSFEENNQSKTLRDHLIKNTFDQICRAASDFEKELRHLPSR